MRPVWVVVFVALLACVLLYPITAARARIHDRFAGAKETTLDGNAYMRTVKHSEKGTQFDLRWDHEAIQWLLENVEGSPVIAEAASPEQYRWASRVSINTGLPTIIGWNWHQKQQRKKARADRQIDKRRTDVHVLYSLRKGKEILLILERYNVDYIYVGPLERIYYAAKGIEKFEAENGRYWERVYKNDGVRIYKVLRPDTGPTTRSTGRLKQ